MKSAAEYIKRNKHDIIDSWEEAVNEEISASEATETLLLRNLLPNLLDDIAGVMLRREGGIEDLKKEDCSEIIRKSVDHGRHRATSSHYTVKQMIKEYIILNRVLTDILISEDKHNAEICILLTHILETSMAHSITSFSDSLQEMREKLVGTLAHDMRNPISAAYFAIDTMKHQEGEERFNKVKRMAKESLRRSIDLMEGLLDAISVEAGEGITLNFSKGNISKEVHRVYDEAIEIYSNEIKLKCEEEEIEAVFDGTAIRRILENLLTNAMKYGARDEPITIAVENEKNALTINVHNRGNPISSENKEIIFDFLESNEQESSGELKSWGMGLTFVKMAAEAHGGHVELKSTQETGTTFSVVLQKFSNQPGKVRSKLNYKE